MGEARRRAATRQSLLSAFLSVTLLTSVVVPRTSYAQSASNKAAAEALFDEGVELLKKGKIEEACSKLERSQRVDPGIGTLLYLGECYKKAGRTASAWATFREAASKAEAAGETDRARAGNKRADELEGELSRVTFEVAEANQNIADLEILQAGSPVNRALWGSEVPVDPGELVVVAKAPGYQSFEAKMQIAKGPSKASLQIPALVPLEPGVVEEPAAQEDPRPSATPEDTPAKSGSAQRTAGLVVGAVGIVGLGLGGVFGGLAIGKKNAASEFCEGSTCQPGSDGVALTDTGLTFATVSTVGFIAGGALLATGAVLYFTAPRATGSAKLKVSPTVGGAHVSLGGAF